MPVYALDQLAPGRTIDGAAIVESATTTVLLRPGDRAGTPPSAGSTSPSGRPHDAAEPQPIAGV